MKRYTFPGGFPERDAGLYLEWDGEAVYRVRKLRNRNAGPEACDGSREEANWFDHAELERRVKSGWIRVPELAPWSMRGLPW